MAQRLRKRQRVSYVEPSDNIEGIEGSDEDAPRPRQSHRHNGEYLLRPLTKSRTQTAQSDEEQLEHQELEALVNEAARVVSKKKRKSARIAVQTRSAANKSNGSGAAMSKRKPSKKADVKPMKLRRTTVDPRIAGFRLAELPYDILLESFKLAAHPLIDHTTLAVTDGVKWLINLATVCRDFTEPALTALYEDPPLTAGRAKVQLLADLLAQDPARTAVDYRAKIRYLHLGAHQHLHAPAPAYGPGSQLAGLVAPIANLKGFHVQTVPHPVYADTFPTAIERWVRPVLDASEFRLREFTLDVNMMHRRLFVDTMAWASGSCALATIEELTVQHAEEDVLVQFGNSVLDRKPRLNVAALRDFIASRDRLRSLRILDSEVVFYPNTEGYAAPLIPDALLMPFGKDLSSVEFSGCLRLDSETLTRFLKENGRKLTTLTLSRNVALGLGFLSGLDTVCPNLQTLTADFFDYPDPHPVDHPAWPKFPSGTWSLAVPPSLRSIAIVNLKYVTRGAAIALFQAFLARRERMPLLRSLVLSLSCTDLTPRERAQFKQEWVERTMIPAFLSRATPRPELMSLAAFAAWKERQFQRRPIGEDEEGEGSAGKRRLRPIGGEGEPGPEEAEGTCTRVQITVDGMRPAAHQYREEDFFSDGEDDYDEDWNGQDMDEDAYW